MAADVDQMTAPPARNPETMEPRELYANIWRILTIRDNCKFPSQLTVIAVAQTLAQW